MSSGMLRPNQVVFYHPLDDFVERTQAQTWTGTAGFTAGKIPPPAPIGASAVTADAFSFGAERKSGGGSTYPRDVVGLSATRALLLGATNAGVGSYVATVNGTDITYGAKGANGGIYSEGIVTHGAKLSWDGTNGKAGVYCRYYGYTGVVSVSGTTVTSSFVYMPGVDPNPSYGGGIAALSSTTFLVTTKTGPLGAFAVVCTVSGSSLTFGAKRSFPSPAADCYPDSVAALDSTHVLVFFQRGATTPPAGAAPSEQQGRAVVATISGTDVTFGAEVDVTAAPGSADVWRIWDVGSNQVTSCAVALDSSKVLLLWPTKNGKGYARVASVSGTGITLGAQATFEPATGSEVNYLRAAHMGGGRVCVSYNNNPGTGWSGWARTGLVSGVTVSFGARTAVTTARGVAVLSATECLVGYSVSEEQAARVGVLANEASMNASSGGAYPAATGDDRVVVAMWANKLGAGSSSVTVKRDYTVTITASSIELGPATAVWNDSDITDLLGSLSGGTHFLVLDFEHTGSGNWNLRTSVDESGVFTNQGAQNSGSRSTAPASLAPGLTITNGASGQWIDELAMWAGDKAAFPSFTTEELTNLYDLADTFGDPMDQYENDYGAPLCWQATARMPDGSIWRDSGCGPCPPVVRVPRGASDIVVTDDGMPAGPRIVEG